MTDSLTLWLGERLVIGSIQGAMVIALVWLVCRLAPRIPAATQALLWWLAALKLLLVFVPAPAVPIAVLPADFARPAELLLPVVAVTPAAHDATEPAPAAGGSESISALSAWLPAVVLLWLALVLVQAARLIHAHRVLRGVVRRSVAWSNDATVALARRVGLRRAPEVRLSEEIDTPQVCGLWNPVVLVPGDTMQALTADERSMTLCHELMHIRRRDLAFGWIPACAERLFFFHPLARLAAREYVAAREAACDAGAVRALGVSAGDYGRLLVRLGIGNARPALAAGGSAFSASSLKRRLHMLERDEHPNVSRRWGWAVALAAAALIPMQLVARTPAAAPQDTAKLQKLTRPARPVERAQAEVERAKESEAKLTEKNREQVEIASAMARIAEKARAEAEQARAEAEQARSAAEKPRYDADTMRRRVAKRVEQRQLEKVDGQVVSKLQSEEFAQQIRQLAERLEALASEQRQLSERLRVLLERQASPAR